jgi:glyoxylase-like metal-dependent hydrolase (beta-lactamase superfamily II)
MVQFRNDFITVFESSLFKTTSTVVCTDDVVLVVDPNWLPHEVETTRQWVEVCTNKSRLLYLLFTHSDYDHILGYGAFPGAKVIASQAFAEHPDKEAAIEEVRKWDDEYYIQRKYPYMYPQVDEIIRFDGQTLNIGSTVLTFYLAPGHNRDGIFTIIEDEKHHPAVWIAGDYLSNVEFPYMYYSSDDYETTLSKVDIILKKHPVPFLIPGHGEATSNPAEILRRKDESLEYIRSLRQSLIEGTTYDERQLWKRYSFRRGMERFHRENVALMRRELGV